MNEQEISEPSKKLIFVECDIPQREFLKIKEKHEEASQPINVRELLRKELDRLSDEDRRGEWDTLPNEMKYLKRKLCETLRSYITLLDQLEKCEDKNSGL